MTTPTNICVHDKDDYLGTRGETPAPACSSSFPGFSQPVVVVTLVWLMSPLCRMATARDCRQPGLCVSIFPIKCQLDQGFLRTETGRRKGVRVTGACHLVIVIVKCVKSPAERG